MSVCLIVITLFLQRYDFHKRKKFSKGQLPQFLKLIIGYFNLFISQTHSANKFLISNIPKQWVALHKLPISLFIILYQWHRSVGPLLGKPMIFLC